MGLDSAKFAEVQQRAKRIMDMDRQGKLDKYTSKDGAELLENGEINFEPTTKLVNMPTQQPIQTDRAIPSGKKLPKEILESFANNQIDTSGLEIGTSVLDALNVPNVPKQKKVIKETTYNNAPTQQAYTNSNIVDYSLIKTIVEDCMRKSMSSIKKSLITEGNTASNDNLAIMKIGESFKFVTSNGDVYEAKLVKKGNINEKRKTKA